ncbi:unnamed protein product [Psylliodes chrysocephalus]|uniref:Regulatory protein zeste n=1 Tax=Psylliodes chrysocephalus TaxID=3402493 RepID=A0A9P0D8I3_9CUCU|nr:unnamed protein product [Psylliodes chrysocephala]
MSSTKMLKIKKKESSSFSKEGEIRLLNAVYSQRKIIENKETNKFTNIEKDKAWEKVAVVYNAHSLEYRNTDQLKSKFDNLKTKTRKIVAQERAHIKGTGGGGPLPPDYDPVIQLIVKIINWKTVVGLENTFGSDYTANDIEDGSQTIAEVDIVMEDQNSLLIELKDGVAVKSSTSEKGHNFIVMYTIEHPVAGSSQCSNELRKPFIEVQHNIDDINKDINVEIGDVVATVKNVCIFKIIVINNM